MREGFDMDAIGKTLPLKATKIPMSRTNDIQHADVKEISHLDPSSSYKHVDHLTQRVKYTVRLRGRYGTSKRPILR